MFSSIFTKIYLALSGFKRNVKSLPGNPEAFEDDKVAAIRIDIHELAALLDNIACIFESGLTEEDIFLAVRTVERLTNNETIEMYYNVYYKGELVGLTVEVTRDQLAMPVLYFITEESLIYELRGILAAFHPLQNGVVH